MYLDLLTGVQLSVAHAAVVLQVGGRPERAERVGDVVRCREVHSMSVRATNNAITRTIAIGSGCHVTVSLNPQKETRETKCTSINCDIMLADYKTL